jgi:putative redox protein
MGAPPSSLHAAASRAETMPSYRTEVRVRAHSLVTDEPSFKGGGDTSASPFELVLSGLAACTATTLRMYAHHKGFDLATVDVDVRYDRDGDGGNTIERTITVNAHLSALSSASASPTSPSGLP